MKTETIREWYMKKYPTDECGKEINPEATFFSVLVGMAKGRDFYDEVYGDSIIREKCFAEMANRLKCNYDNIYYLWLSTSETFKRLYPDGAKKGASL